MEKNKNIFGLNIENISFGENNKDMLEISEEEILEIRKRIIKQAEEEFETVGKIIQSRKKRRVK